MASMGSVQWKSRTCLPSSCRAASCSFRDYSRRGGEECCITFCNDRLNTSWLLGSIARLTCRAMVRSEECSTSAGLKSNCIQQQHVIINISVKIKIRFTMWSTFVFMANRFLASSSDAVPCVRYAKTPLKRLEMPSSFDFNQARCDLHLPHEETSAAGCPSGM